MEQEEQEEQEGKSLDVHVDELHGWELF